MMKKYILSVCAAALLSYLCYSLSIGRVHQKRLWYVGTLVIALVILSPLVCLDEAFLERAFSAYTTDIDLWETQTEAAAYQRLKDNISSRCEAYILEQTRTWGIPDPDLEFHYSGQKDSLAPISVTIHSSCGADDRARLEAIISQNLNIPKERQLWYSTSKAKP